MATARAAIGGERTVAGHARVEAMLREHHGALLRIARRWSGSAEAAEDALQRAMEIYVRRLDSLDPATELAWLKVVVRHEAMAVQRASTAAIPLETGDLAERFAAPDATVEERIEREERTAQSLEALAGLKPDERTALLLKANGLSYREIGERQGWTYTKVNRAITEGRRRFLDTVARIESGEECERFAPTLLALTQGAADAADVVALRPHLRHCGACRGTVRELVDSRRRRLILHLPLFAGAAPLRWLGADEPAGAVERGSSVKQALHGAVARFTSPDVATGVQLGSSGGGRGPAVAALLSLCLGGGAGTYCVATGGLPDPVVRLVHRSDDPGRERDKAKRRAAASRDERAAAPTPTPTPLPATPARPVSSAPEVASRTPEPSEAKVKAKPKRRSAPEEEFGFEGATGTPGLAGGSGGGAAPASTASTAPSAPTGGGSVTNAELVATADERRGVPAVRGLFVSGLVALLLAALPAPARAGTYDVWSCRKPDATRAALSGWHYVGVVAASDLCPMYGFSAGLSREGSVASDTSGLVVRSTSGHFDRPATSCTAASTGRTRAGADRLGLRALSR